MKGILSSQIKLAHADAPKHEDDLKPASIMCNLFVESTELCIKVNVEK